MFANLTVIGSVVPDGIVPFNCLMAASASDLVSKRTNPTPFDNPEQANVVFK